MAGIEIIRTERRRRYSEGEKAALLAEVDRGGCTVAEVARRHGMAEIRKLGCVMFSAALSVGTRLNDWKMNPSRSLRSAVISLSSNCERSVSPM